MSQALQHPKSAPPKESSVIEKVSTETHEWYFKQCDANRDLLNDIYVVVPVRPADGMNCHLHRMLATWYGEGTAFADLNDNMGGFIECTRANIAYNFLNNPPLKPDLKTPCRYLLMIDNDMEPPLGLPYMLARHGKGVVGAPAMSVTEKFGPQLTFTILDTEGKYRFPCLRSGLPIPSKGLLEVGHIGTGAILISRDVLEKFTFDGDDIPFIVPQSARIRGMKTGELLIGEDISFCNQLRAKGIPMYVDLEAHVGHKKTLTLSWDEDMRDPYLDPQKWVLPPIGKEIVSR